MLATVDPSLQVSGAWSPPRLSTFEKGIAAALQYHAIYVAAPVFERPWLNGNRVVERTKIGATASPGTIQKALVQGALGQAIQVIPIWFEGDEFVNRVLDKLKVELSEDALGLTSGWLDVGPERAIGVITFQAELQGFTWFSDKQRHDRIMAAVARRTSTRAIGKGTTQYGYRRG